MTIITPAMTYLDGSPWEARVSKLSQSGEPEFYVRLLADEAATQTPAWRALLGAIKEVAEAKFGVSGYADLLKSGFRSPIRFDVAGKPFPASTVAFFTLKSRKDNPPMVLGPDAIRIMDRGEVYGGMTARASLRAYAWGGKSAGFNPGVSLGLLNIQKLADGPRLASARADGSEFGPVDDGLSSLIN